VPNTEALRPEGVASSLEALFRPNSTEEVTSTCRLERYGISEPLAEIVEARIWAGLHYRTADVQGLNLGQEVARWAQHHYFQPLP
jgi:hypothetical protein